MLISASADGGKKPTEDRHIIKRLNDGRVALAVFDGHGGIQVADIAVRTFEAKISEAPTVATADWLKAFLLDLDTSHIIRRYKTVGSTATIIIVTPTEIIGAYLGDSPALLFSVDTGVLLQGTIDHHPSRVGEKTRITGAGGFVEKELGDVARVNGVLAVSRALGDYELKPALSAVADTFVWRRPVGQSCLAIMSDGMLEKPSGGNYTKKQVATALAMKIREHGADAATVAIAEQEAAMEFEGDNLSLILMSVGLDSTQQVTQAYTLATGGGTLATATKKPFSKTRRKKPQRTSPHSKRSKSSS